MHAFCILLQKHHKVIKKGWKITIIIFAVIGLITASSLIILNSEIAQTFIIQKIANTFTKNTSAKISIGKVRIAFFNKVILEEIAILDAKTDTLLYAKSISSKIDSFNYKGKKAALKQIQFKQAKFNIQKDTSNTYNFQFLIDALKKQPKNTQQPWIITCNSIQLSKSEFAYSDASKATARDLQLTDFNIEVSKLSFKNQKISCIIKDLSFIEPGSFHLEKLTTNALYMDGKVSLSNLSVLTQYSNIEEAEFELKWEKDSIEGFRNEKLNLDLNASEISLEDLASFVPALKGMDLKTSLSGNFSGSFNNLKGHDVLLTVGDSTYLDCNFSLNDMSSLKDMFIFLDIKNTQVDFNDLGKIKLPAKAKTQNLVFPRQVLDAGLVTYEGNFTGFINDFVSYGKLKSKMGDITTDISIVPNEEGKIVLNGELATNKFKAGLLFAYNRLGEITFSGDTYGVYDSQSGIFNGTFQGLINSIDINNYIYKNIRLDGGFFDKKFDGYLSIDDPNLRLDFQGILNLKPAIPQFDFDLFLYNADLKALHIDTYNEISDLAFQMKANFIGNSIDNLVGSIKIENGNYRNENGDLPLSGATLQSVNSDEFEKLQFFSEYADISIAGDYDFISLKNSILKIVHSEIPAYKYHPGENTKPNNFEYQFDGKDLGKIVSLFKPELTIIKPFAIEGNINSVNDKFNISGNIPGINYKNMVLRDISIFADADKSLNSSVKLGEFHTENGLSLYNVALITETNSNKTSANLTWNNYHKLTYSGGINTEVTFQKSNNSIIPKAIINVSPSKVYIADTLWHIDEARITIDSTSIGFDNLRFHHQDQLFEGNGKISENKSDKLLLYFNNIGLKQLDKYLQVETEVDGILNGSIGVSDVYGQTFLSSDATISDLFFRNQSLGKLSFVNEWNNEQNVVNTNLKIENNQSEQLSALGYYDPANNYLNFDARFDHLSLVFLEKLIRNNFSNFQGDAIGKMHVYGNPQKIMMDGIVMAENAGVTIDNTQVNYHFSDSVIFSKDSIIFDHIQIHDIENNWGQLNGYITQDNFRNMRYDIEVSSPKIMALNTSPKDNEIFYGRVYGNGELSVTGNKSKVRLDGSATTLTGTNVNISLEYGEDAETYDFIQFVKHESFLEEKEELFLTKEDNSFDMNLTINATPDAKVQIIYNSQLGDIIKAEGDGVMRFAMDKDGNIELYGDYRIAKGDYLFTLQNIINKKFTIGEGSSIVWTGDPYNATIDINAVYKLKASLYELFVNSYENIDYTQRIPVDSKIILTDDLINPTIKFDIEFPTAEDRIVDELQQFFNTEEEMNRQILSLLVLGQFYTPEYMRGTYEASSTNVIGTTASELFSNQLSKWLSQISNNWDIGLNYRPSTQLTNDEVELALSTQIFNDRVTINGNVGNNANPTDNNNSQLVGDFDLKVKLTDNGKLQLKAYNRSNNNLIYETAPYTQGLGFTYKEEFNTMEELLDKFISLFKSNKRQ